jgi:hypothetical protein
LYAEISGKIITHEIASSLKPLILLHKTLTKDSLRKLIDNDMISNADISFPSTVLILDSLDKVWLFGVMPPSSS